jgi:hypothetical protein
MEQQESTQKHGERQSSHGVNKMAPSFVNGIVSSQKAPTNERSDQLTK